MSLEDPWIWALVGGAGDVIPGGWEKYCSLLGLMQTLRQGFDCRWFIWEVIPVPVRRWEVRGGREGSQYTACSNEHVIAVHSWGPWGSLGGNILSYWRSEEARAFIALPPSVTTWAPTGFNSPAPLRYSAFHQGHPCSHRKSASRVSGP